MPRSPRGAVSPPAPVPGHLPPGGRLACSASLSRHHHTVRLVCALQCRRCRVSPAGHTQDGLRAAGLSGLHGTQHSLIRTRETSPPPSVPPSRKSLVKRQRGTFTPRKPRREGIVCPFLSLLGLFHLESDISRLSFQKLSGGEQVGQDDGFSKTAGTFGEQHGGPCVQVSLVHFL